MTATVAVWLRCRARRAEREHPSNAEMTVNDVSEAQDARAAARRIVLDVLAEHGIDGSWSPPPTPVDDPPAEAADAAGADAAVTGTGGVARAAVPTTASRATARRIVEEVLAAHAARATEATAAATAASEALDEPLDEAADEDALIDLVALEADPSVEGPPPPPTEVLAAADTGRIAVPGPASPDDHADAEELDVAAATPPSVAGEPPAPTAPPAPAPEASAGTSDEVEEEPIPPVAPLDEPSGLDDDPHDVARRVVAAVLTARGTSLEPEADRDPAGASAAAAPADALAATAPADVPDAAAVDGPGDATPATDPPADDVVSVEIVEDVVSVEVADEVVDPTPTATVPLRVDDRWLEVDAPASAEAPTAAHRVEPTAAHRVEPAAVADPWEAVVEVPETHEAPPPLPPRTGRWLLATVVGAVAIALLLPLAVAALRDLASLS